ncbi:MAG TPA: SBBP repeat-containing protein [Thermoplasmata archaeon]|nr:SBBP repeat-containing protein [Thermoplasmata archaeon]
MSRTVLAFAIVVSLLASLAHIGPRAVALAPDGVAPGARVPTVGADGFLENGGQLGRTDIRYYARSAGITFGFSRSAILMDLGGSEEPNGVLVRVFFEGARGVEPRASDPLATRTNFFLGSDPAGWRTGLRSYRAISYPNLYDGIDLVYHMEAEGAKYEFTLRPGADLGRLRMSYEGIEALAVGPQGDLLVRTAFGTLADTRPVASQGSDPVSCAFLLRTAESVGFSCPTRDASRALVIDPLVYATFLGGGDYEDAQAIAVDAAGNAYLTGSTRSVDFPVTPGAYNRTYMAGDDAYAAKFDLDGRTLLYATFLGGDGTDVGFGIAVAGGSAVVTGQTDSPNFPILGGFDSGLNQSDGFVAKLGPDGDVLLYATFLGGALADFGRAVAVDGAGNAYVTGFTSSADFPTTAGAFDTTFNGFFSDAFLAKLNPSGTGLVFGTFLGGTQPPFNLEIGWDVAVDMGGSAYVVGTTNAVDFPATAGAFNDTLNGQSDAFVARFMPDGTGLLYGTYVGGSGGESALAVAVDGAGRAFIGGNTDSPDLPITPGAFNASYGGATDGYAAALTPAGNALVFATYLGSAREDAVSDISVDALGRATVTGRTNSTDFPTTPWGMDPVYRGGAYDGFLARLDAAGSRLVYGTFLGGGASDIPYALALDGAGDAYVAGITNSTDFPATPGAFNTTFSGGLFDAFAAKVSLTVPVALDTVPTGLQVEVDGTPHTAPYTVPCDPERNATVNAPSPQIASRTRWDFVAWSDGGAPSHTIPCTAPTSLTATFVATEYEITVDTSPPDLFVLVDGPVRNTPFTFLCVPGSFHTLDVPTPQVGAGVRYTFSSWSDGAPRLHGISCDAPATYTAFFTTEYEVTVTTLPANRQVVVDGTTFTAPQSFWWADGSPHTLDVPSPQVFGGTQYTFASWSDGGAKAHTTSTGAPATLTAAFSVQYQTTVTASPIGLQVVVDGNTSTSPVTVWCDAGAPHMIGAPSPQGSSPVRNVFATWSDGGAQTHAIFCTASATYTANFATEYEMRLDTLPTGLGLTLDGNAVTALHAFWCLADSSRTVSAPTPQVSGPTRHVFSQWSDGGALTHVILCAQPDTLIAVFTTEHQVTIQSAPVDLDVTVDGTTARAPLTLWWAEGSTHLLALASPQYPGGPTTTRYAFRVWSDGQVGLSRSVTVAGPLTLTATFDAEHPIQLDSNPAGRALLVDGISVPMPQTFWWREGTSHTLGATTPQLGGTGVRFAFLGWSDGGPASRTVVASAPLLLVGEFTTQYYLSLSSPYGTPWCEPADCWHDAGTVAAFGVDLRVDGPTGVRFLFDVWSGDLTTGSPVAAIRMDGPRSENAEWTTEYLLQVVSVYGNATGGDWYPAGASASFSVVARESTIGDVQYRFVRWTGDVNSTATSGTILMDGPKTVVAQWERIAFYESPLVWLLPVVVALLLLLFFLFWRRRKKDEPDERTEPKTQAPKDGDRALSDLEDEIDLDGRPER